MKNKLKYLVCLAIFVSLLFVGAQASTSDAVSEDYYFNVFMQKFHLHFIRSVLKLGRNTKKYPERILYYEKAKNWYFRLWLTRTLPR